MSTKPTPKDRYTVSPIFLPREIFIDPTSADAIALIGPTAPLLEASKRRRGPVTDSDKRQVKTLAGQQVGK